MRFVTIGTEHGSQAAIALGDGTWAPLELLDPSLAGDMFTLLVREPSNEDLCELHRQALSLPAAQLVKIETSDSPTRFAPPLRRPRKIWGIGLNYREHAADLAAPHPDQPASFMKGDHTIIGPGQPIQLPLQSGRVTAEAELGLVMGRLTRNVTADQALEGVFGVCAVLDQTAEDILALNPRYLTRSKNFPTFFSFGPEVVTLDEFLASSILEEIVVSTILNGEVVRANTIGNMAHSPAELVSFHSYLMPLYPGDIISTGTPGAAVITDGDVAEAHVAGLAHLSNPVRADERI
jgi:2-keto-4-pentenoate hydratase/2-oxohepta-3-ene-1,7-dioic acid hydratase in catechol pathway